MPLLFVYGSLKQGFPNFHVNKGQRVAGDYATVQPYPLYLINGQLPCMFATPGTGLRVTGQLFDTDADALQAMDLLERVGEPGGYQRVPVDVAAIGAMAGPVLSAFVDVQDPGLLSQPGPHVGPIATYTAEHAQSLRW